MPDNLILPVIVSLFIVLDIITGIAQAIANKDVSSSKLREGAFHKFAYILILCGAYLVEYAMGYVDLGFTIPIFQAACVYIIFTEIVSFGENIVKLNPSLKGTKILGLFRNDNIDLAMEKTEEDKDA